MEFAKWQKEMLSFVSVTGFEVALLSSGVMEGETPWIQ